MYTYKKTFRFIALSLILISILGCTTKNYNNNFKSKKDSPQRKKQEKTNPENLPKDPIITATSDYTYSKMKEQINQLNKRYKKIKTSSIGNSVANRNLYLLRLGNGKKKIAVVGGFHGRESITSLLVLKLIEDYSKNKSINNYNLKKILNQTSFYFIPMINPDGVEIAVNGIKNLKDKNFYIKANEGSSNFKRWKANARGVDLNKQFNADWEEVKAEDQPHFAHYKGSKAESEPESKALADLSRKERFDAIIAFHNSGNVIYWYYNQNTDTYKRDYLLAKKISSVNHYKLITPDESNKKAAGYKDWFIKKFNKPGFTIEIGNTKSEEQLPAFNLNKYFKENRTVLLELAQNI
ncbi:M14 family zinc carboxypeptidase [Orenia marismortui]|uniref:M14 family zinc carboxypeptidase n=1 Tax=Orenia marismortui TaxID=46469 RepID=UPI00036AFD0A|nr:M14 family zinc carboxypeptidase [Orenia marismortui]